MDGQDGLRCVDSVVLGQHTAGQVDKCWGADKNYKGGWREQTARAQCGEHLALL